MRNRTICLRGVLAAGALVLLAGCQNGSHLSSAQAKEMSGKAPPMPANAMSSIMQKQKSMPPPPSRSDSAQPPPSIKN